MNSIPKGYIEVRKGVYERISTIQRKFMRKKTSSKTGRRTQVAKSKPPLWDEPLSTASGEKNYTGRLLVSIESVRKKLLDTDNLYGGAKFFVDFLRYCGAIEEDTEAKIDLRVTQRTVLKNEREKTIIEVWKRER